MTASQPPHPAPASTVDATLPVESGEGPQVNPQNVESPQKLDEADAADVPATFSHTEVAGSSGVTFATSGNGLPRQSVSEPWLRGSSARRLQFIDRRLRTAVLLQAVIVCVVLGLWLLGKLSWNHDPLVSQGFRPLELPALTSRAQNAALEFHHDLVTGEFGQARLLVVEEAEKLVEDAAASCLAPSPCASKEPVFTRATLLRAAGSDARVFVESFAADGRPVGEATYNLSHASGRWLVTERVTPSSP